MVPKKVFFQVFFPGKGEHMTEQEHVHNLQLKSLMQTVRDYSDSRNCAKTNKRTDPSVILPYRWELW